MPADDHIISVDVLNDIAFRAKITISDEQKDDFRKSLTSIVNMFHDMSKVNVCEYKQYSFMPTNYEDLQQDTPKPCPSYAVLETTCPHFNIDTGYFEVPKVIDEE